MGFWIDKAPNGDIRQISQTPQEGWERVEDDHPDLVAYLKEKNEYNSPEKVRMRRAISEIQSNPVFIAVLYDLAELRGLSVTSLINDYKGRFKGEAPLPNGDLPVPEHNLPGHVHEKFKSSDAEEDDD